MILIHYFLIFTDLSLIIQIREQNISVFGLTNTMDLKARGTRWSLYAA